MDVLIPSDGVAVRELASWRDFVGLGTTEFVDASAYVYRGQADWQWQVTTTLDRHEARYPKRKAPSGSVPEFFENPPFTEEEHLAAFRRAIRGRRGPAPAQLDDDACWALGQHHGLVTPLLDWTRSPFIALYFAFEEERVVEGAQYIEPDHRAVFALSTSVWETQGKEPKNDLRFVSPDVDDNFRLTSQASIMVRLPRRTDLEALVKRRFQGDSRRAILAKVKIPNDGRHDCLAALSKMGINRMTLFPDIAGAAKHVNSLWQPGHEDSIAYV